MKALSFMFGMAVVFGFANANARGVDESLHRCIAVSGEQLGPAGTAYDLHLVVGQSMTLTSLTDGKSITGTYDSGWRVYRFEGANPGGVFEKVSYSYGVDESKSLTMTYTFVQGTATNNRLTCTLTRQISIPAPLSKTESKLEAIANDASENIGNGEWATSEYKVSDFDAKKERAKLLAKRKGWPNCKFSSTEGDAAILTLKTSASDTKAFNRVTKLKETPGLKAILAETTEPNESCMETWVWVYTNDGYVLKLNYSQGD